MKALPILTLALAIFSILPVLPAHGAAKADAEAEQAVLKFEQDWANAYVKGDAETLERIMAEEFIFTGPDGVIQTKADDVRNLKSGALKMTECKLEDVQVRIYGKTAIVTGVNMLKGSLDGQDISGKYRFTDVLVRKKDKWQAVSAHASAVTGKK
jgi:ketosteroid isomerase-like protein